MIELIGFVALPALAILNAWNGNYDVAAFLVAQSVWIKVWGREE